MKNVVYVRSINGRYVSTYSLSHRIISGVLVTGFVVAAVAFSLFKHPVVNTAQAANLPQGCSKDGVMLNCDLTDSKTIQMVYKQAKEGSLKWITPQEAEIEVDVSKYQSKYPYASASVLKTIVNIAKEKGYNDIDHLVALINCESHFQIYATNGKKNIPAGSVDRGIAMFSSFWQRSVTDMCAFNADCAVRAMIDRLQAGQEGLWVCSKLIK